MLDVRKAPLRMTRINCGPSTLNSKQSKGSLLLLNSKSSPLNKWPTDWFLLTESVSRPQNVLYADPRCMFHAITPLRRVDTDDDGWNRFCSAHFHPSFIRKNGTISSWKSLPAGTLGLVHIPTTVFRVLTNYRSFSSLTPKTVYR